MIPLISSHQWVSICDTTSCKVRGNFACSKTAASLEYPGYSNYFNIVMTFEVLPFKNTFIHWLWCPPYVTIVYTNNAQNISPYTSDRKKKSETVFLLSSSPRFCGSLFSLWQHPCLPGLPHHGIPRMCCRGGSLHDQC